MPGFNLQTRFGICFVSLVLAAGCFFIPGCVENKPVTTVTTATLEPAIFSQAEPNQHAQQELKKILAVHLRTVIIEVPAGQISNSEEIWSYLQEEPIGAERLSTLSRNGWRVALGRSDSWPDVTKLLKEMTGSELIHADAVTRPGSPLHLPIKSSQPVQTIFQFHEDKTISGSDFPHGDNVLSVVCTVDPDNTNRLITTAMPQVRARKTEQKYELTSVGAKINNTRKMFGFRDMLFQLPLARDEFIVIGPGIASRRFNSVGRQFLVHQKEGMDFETIIILKPAAVKVVPKTPHNQR